MVSSSNGIFACGQSIHTQSVHVISSVSGKELLWSIGMRVIVDFSRQPFSFLGLTLLCRLVLPSSIEVELPTEGAGETGVWPNPLNSCVFASLKGMAIGLVKPRTEGLGSGDVSSLELSGCSMGGSGEGVVLRDSF
jgi:hypothetical protein